MVRLLYSFPHRLGATGIGITAYEQVRGAIATGHDVTVFCASAARPIPGARRVVETMIVAGVRIPHRVVGVERAWRLHDHVVARHLGDAQDLYDIVHGWPLASLETFRMARLVGTATVREAPNTHTAHAFAAAADASLDAGTAIPRGHSHRFDRRRLGRELEEYREADTILTPSDVVARTFLERGWSEDQLGRHRYGCDLDRFFPRPRSPDAPFTLLFAGSCEPRKGLHVALEAWRRSGIGRDGGRFLVLGDFVPGYRSALAHLLSERGVVHLRAPALVADVMGIADALVLPSFEEGSALVTYEAQASGCALLVSNAAGARCEHEVQGLLHDPGDVETLAWQMRRVFDEPLLLGRLRREALAHRDELSWRVAAATLSSIYEGVVPVTRGAA